MQSSRGPLVFIIDTRQVSMLYIRLHSHDFFFRQLKEDIQVQSNKAQREARKGEELKKELSQAKSDLENRTAELKTKTENLQRAQEDITKLDQQLKEQRVNLLRVFIQFSFIFKKKLLGFPWSWILL